MLEEKTEASCRAAMTHQVSRLHTQYCRCNLGFESPQCLHTGGLVYMWINKVCSGCGYSHMEAPLLYTCACGLKRGVAQAHMCYPLHIEFTTIRARTANKCQYNLTLQWFLYLVAMLAIKRSAGVTPEVNVRNPLSTDDKHTSEGSTLTLKPRADVIRSPKQNYQLPHKKD